MKKLIIFAFAVVIIVCASYFVWKHFAHDKSNTDTKVTAEVQRGNIENLVAATGTLEPLDYVDVGAQVSGQLEKLHVEIGSEVKKGDLLAEIDPTIFMTKVDSSRAQLRYQKAQLKDREAQLFLNETQFKRQQNLKNEDATTTEALQSAEASYKSAAAQLEMLKAQINQTESTLRADEANLNYTKIYAPMDGTVVSITARQGQTLNANQSAPTILQIADLSTMTVQTEVSEADIVKLKTGMKAYFTTLGSQNRRWSGELRRIEPTPTTANNVVLYKALFDVENSEKKLLPKMTAQVFFITESAENTLLVPATALKINKKQGKGPKEAEVTVLKNDGTTEQRQVTIGISNRINAQIIEGLSEGETVLLNSSVERKSPAQNSPQPPAGLGGFR